MAIEIDTGGVVGGGGLLATAAAIFSFFRWRSEAATKREETTVGQYIVMVNALQADIVRLNAARAEDAVRHAAALASITRQLDDEMERRRRDWEAANEGRNALVEKLNHMLQWCATQGYAVPDLSGDGSNLYPSLQGPKSRVTPKEPT